ncbi:MAG TPA: murein L,D-transpeptidase catalytic domain family protein [Longimicrobium sp.]|nr:murein L,D-transpeptidase catalytic domain family protein [Longimicrobium sp.]
MNQNLQALAAAAVFFGIAASLPNDSESAAAPAERAQQPAAATALAPAARAVLSGVGIEKKAAPVEEMSEAETALAAFAGSIRKQSHPDALRLAFEAYYNYKAEHPNEVRKPYLYFVDYGLDSRTKRGYVFDMKRLRIVDGPFAVAHGRGSGAKYGVPTKFTNREGSATSSLGLFKAREVYAFTGHASGQVYRSVGLRLDGVSGRFNSAARQRRVVVHGAPYVSETEAGRSEGCPAMDPKRARKLIPTIGNGGMVFLFSPVDKTWLKSDPWVHRDAVNG